MKTNFATFAKHFLFLGMLVFQVPYATAQTVDYSVVSVIQETGIDFTQITSAGDYVSMPSVKRSRRAIDWYTNRIIDVSPDGQNLAFLSFRGDHTNVFIKNVTRQGASVQRTNRTSVQDFSYSPDGKFIVFSEAVGNNSHIFQTDANNGFICRQITSGSKDYSPIYSADKSKIFFSRQEQNTANIWSYDIEKNFLSSYTSGLNPEPGKNGSYVFCTRTDGKGKAEIWRVDYNTGVEECIIASPDHSFSTPSLSPDGQWVLCTGSSLIEDGKLAYWNTDIYVCRTDGTRLTQLTFHAADDLSPVWSQDGRYIFFISQRGNAEGVANVWRMPFNVL